MVSRGDVFTTHRLRHQTRLGERTLYRSISTCDVLLTSGAATKVFGSVTLIALEASQRAARALAI